MVKVRQDHPIAADGQVDIEAWIDRLNRLDNQSDNARTELRRAATLSLSLSAIHKDDDHSWGEDFSCFRIGLEMAEILADLQLDSSNCIFQCLQIGVGDEKFNPFDP